MIVIYGHVFNEKVDFHLGEWIMVMNLTYMMNFIKVMKLNKDINQIDQNEI